MSKVTHGVGRPRTATWVLLCQVRALLCPPRLCPEVSYPAKDTAASLGKIRPGHPSLFLAIPMTSCSSYNQKGRALLGDRSHTVDLGKKYFPSPLLALASPGEWESGAPGLVFSSTIDLRPAMVRRTFLFESQSLPLSNGIKD